MGGSMVEMVETVGMVVDGMAAGGVVAAMETDGREKAVWVAVVRVVGLAAVMEGATVGTVAAAMVAAAAALMVAAAKVAATAVATVGMAAVDMVARAPCSTPRSCILH